MSTRNSQRIQRKREQKVLVLREGESAQSPQIPRTIHEAYKNEKSGEQTLSRGRKYRKPRTGGIAQVHRGREAQSEDRKESVGDGIEKET